jgi:hypothetical protein
MLAEALERCDRVRHVYVHAGGKIEALGTVSQLWAHPRDTSNNSNNNTTSNASGGNVETICVVDVRDNHPDSAAMPGSATALLAEENGTLLNATTSNNNNSFNNFQPRQLLHTQSLQNMKAPQRAQSPSPMKTHKDREKNQRTLNSANAALTQSQSQAHALSQKEQQHQLVREYEEQLVKLRESGWQGRSEGLDISRSLQSPMLLLDASMDPKLPGMNNKKKKVNSRTTTLPPLSNSNSNSIAGDIRPSSSGGAAFGGGRLPETFGVDIERNPEFLLHQNNTNSNVQEDSAVEDSEYEPDGDNSGEGEKKKKKKKKTKKRMSETEKRLMASPFAQPLVKH